MSEPEEEQLTLASWQENQAILSGGTKLHPDYGTYTLSTNTVKGALEVTAAAFGLIALDNRFQSHVNWLVGDLMWNGTDRFGDPFVQELDGFANIAGWTARGLALRERTSRLFSDVSLRRHSYDLSQWAEFFPDQEKAGVKGVSYPLSWQHYASVGSVKDVDLLNQVRCIQLMYFLRESPAESRSLLKLLLELCEDQDAIGESLDELLESARESTLIAFEMIDQWKAQAKENDPPGKFLLLTLNKSTMEMDCQKVSELTPVRFEEADLVLQLGGKEKVRMVITYDGFNAELESIQGIV